MVVAGNCLKVLVLLEIHRERGGGRKGEREQERERRGRGGRGEREEGGRGGRERGKERRGGRGSKRASAQIEMEGKKLFRTFYFNANILSLSLLPLSMTQNKLAFFII